MYKIVILFFGLICILFLTSCFIIQEGEQGIILRFGKILKDTHGKDLNYRSGLHYKFPVIEDLRTIDVRSKTLNVENNHFFTKNGKDFIIDYYIQWKITNFSQYFSILGDSNILQAEELLKRKVNEFLRLEIVKLTSKEILMDSKKLSISLRKIYEKFSFGLFTVNSVENYDVFRKNHLQKLSKYFNSKKFLGVQVLDVRIKKIHIPDEIIHAIYDRILSEQEKIVCNQRLQMLEQSNKIRDKADYISMKIISKVKKYAIMLQKEGNREVDCFLKKIFN